MHAKRALAPLAFTSTDLDLLSEITFIEPSGQRDAWLGKKLGPGHTQFAVEPALAAQVADYIEKERLHCVTGGPGTGKSAVAYFAARRAQNLGVRPFAFASTLYALTLRSREDYFRPAVDAWARKQQAEGLLIIDDAQHVFGGESGGQRLAYLLSLQRQYSFGLLLVYTIRDDVAPVSSTTSVAIPPSDICRTTTIHVAESSIREAVLQYAEQMHLNIPVAFVRTIAFERQLSAWKLMHFIRIQAGEKAAILPSDDPLRRLTLYLVSLESYVADVGMSPRRLLGEIRRYARRQLGRVVASTALRGISATAILDWARDDSRLNVRFGTIEPLHQVQARQLLIELTNDTGTLSRALNVDFGRVVSGRLRNRAAVSRAARIVRTLDSQDKRALRSAASALVDRTTGVFGSGHRFEGREGLYDAGVLLAAASDAAGICDGGQALNRLLDDAVRTLNLLVRRAGTSWGIYQVGTVLFGPWAVQRLNHRLLERLDTKFIAEVLSKAQNGSQVMDLVVSLDGLRGLERMRFAEEVLIRGSSVLTRHRAVRDLVESNHNAAVSGLKDAFRRLAVLAKSENISDVEQVCDNQLAVLEFSGADLANSRTIGKHLSGIWRTAFAIFEHLRERPLKNESSAELFHAFRIALGAGGWIQAEAEVEDILDGAQRHFDIEFWGAKDVQLERLMNDCASLFRAEFAQANVVARQVAAQIDVGLLAKSLEHYPLGAAVVLRSLFVTERRHADEFYRHLTPQQIEAVRTSIVEVIAEPDQRSFDSFSNTLHMPVNSVLCEAFIQFVGARDETVRAILENTPRRLPRRVYELVDICLNGVRTETQQND